MLHGVLGKFMEGLADEFRPGEPTVNPNGFPAALNDRSDSGDARGRICQKDGRMLFTGLTNDEMAKIIPLRCSDSQHLQSCER